MYVENVIYIKIEVNPWLPTGIENFLCVQMMWYKYSNISLRSYLHNAHKIMTVRCIARPLGTPFWFDSKNVHLRSLLILTSLIWILKIWLVIRPKVSGNMIGGRKLSLWTSKTLLHNLYDILWSLEPILNTIKKSWFL